MSKNNQKLIIFSAIFFIGLIIVMNSVGFGTNAVESRIVREGGLQNPVMYYEQYITTYRFLGGILSILGGFGVIINTKVKL